MTGFLHRDDVTPIPKQPAKPKPKWRRPIKPYSERRFSQKEMRAEVVRQVFDRDGHRCRAEQLVPSVACGGPLDPHEIIPRSAWRDGYLVRWNVLCLCRRHHDWVGDHPSEAHRLGLHGFSWEAPTRRRSA